MPKAQVVLRDVYANISPIDFRYWDPGAAEYLDENAFTRYRLRVEIALAKVFRNRGLCSPAVVIELQRACKRVTTAEVYEREKKTKHDVRALVNAIRERMSEETRCFVHMMATSFDINDTANTARFRDVMRKVAIPRLKELLQALIEITLREAMTLQIGRTHGQHAVPLTFGFAMAEYVSRLGSSILKLQDLTEELVGKFSGAVGAYNASMLFFDDPEEFEKEVLRKLGLKPADYSTQIAQPEPLTRLLGEITFCTGILANLARDMRSLQRTEIGEVGEEFEEQQVGSSTMPQKRNPINFENAESLWKVLVGRMVTVLMDQISEHQRDLTNSASGRTYPETVAYFVSMIKRLTRTMEKLRVDKANLERNLSMQGDLIAAEPLYIILAALGYPDAHEKIRLLTISAQSQSLSLFKIVQKDPELQPYLERMTGRQRRVLENPRLYTGIAWAKANTVAQRWAKKLGLRAY